MATRWIDWLIAEGDPWIHIQCQHSKRNTYQPQECYLFREDFLSFNAQSLPSSSLTVQGLNSNTISFPSLRYIKTPHRP